MKRTFFCVSLGVGLFAPAVALAAPPLRIPWTCDDVHEVTNGHDTNTHTGKDAWAWDFGLAVGTDVLAPADGVVRLIKMNSTQGGCNSAYANDANYVVIEFGDGTEALLMHLQHQSSTLQVGDPVAQGDVVGRVGLTGWACGAHLHFQIQGSCDSWWCQSVPAQFVDFGDPGEGVPLASNNCPVSEPCALVLDGSTTVIDDSDPRCFTKVTSWFWPGAGGWEDDAHVYTWANASAQPDTIGVWSFGVDVPGSYRVEAFVPDADANSEQAAYEIQTGDAIVDADPIDQAASKGWVDLGVYDIVEGDEHWVRLADNTGEDRDLDRKVAFDAIRITWEDPAAADGGATSGSGGGEGGATGGAEGDEAGGGGTDGGASPEPDTDPDAGATEGGGDSAALPGPGAGGEDDGSCAVARSGEGEGALPFACLVVLVIAGRRRASRRSIA